MLISLGVANANDSATETSVGGVIDSPLVVNTAASAQQLKDQVNKEQEALAKKNRAELEELAKKGERLAIVALGNDFADEAQQILFAPEAANAAISDALAMYSLAAQRNYLRGTPSLTDSGVMLGALRAVRAVKNK